MEMGDIEMQTNPLAKDRGQTGQTRPPPPPGKKKRMTLQSVQPHKKTWFFFIWLRRNWFLLILILLALAGILISLLLYLQPCKKELVTTTEVINVTTVVNTTRLVNVTTIVNTTRTVYNPADMWFALDQSGSVQSTNWINSVKPAVRATIEVFNSSAKGGFMTGIGRWSDANKHPVDLALTDNIALALTTADGLPYGGGATHVAPGLVECWRQFSTKGFKPVGSFKPLHICTLMTDGANQDALTAYTSADVQGVWDYCSNNGLTGTNECTLDPSKPKNIPKQMKASGINILGVFICAAGQTCTVTNLQKYSSCDQYDATTGYANCQYFAEVDFATLKPKLLALAASLAATIGGVEEVTSESTVNTVEDVTSETLVNSTVNTNTASVCIGNPNNFLFMALIVPLLIYLLFKPIEFCIKRCLRKKTKSITTITSAPAMMPALEEEEELEEVQIAEVVAPPAPAPVAVDDGKKYKWEIKSSDKYLWAMGGGVTAVNVNFGSHLPPPPSAPQALPKKRKTVTQTEWVTVVEKETFESPQEVLAAVYSGGDWQEEVSQKCCPCCWTLVGDDEYDEDGNSHASFGHRVLEALSFGSSKDLTKGEKGDEGSSAHSRDGDSAGEEEKKKGEKRTAHSASMDMYANKSAADPQALGHKKKESNAGAHPVGMAGHGAQAKPLSFDSAAAATSARPPAPALGQQGSHGSVAKMAQSFDSAGRPPPPAGRPLSSAAKK